MITKMNVQAILFICVLGLLFSTTAGEIKWTGLKCGIINQKLLNRNLNFKTCFAYCVSTGGYGECSLNKGFGECRCEY